MRVQATIMYYGEFHQGNQLDYIDYRLQLFLINSMEPVISPNKDNVCSYANVIEEL